MAAYKNPLRAGMACGLPIVTWVTSSAASVVATANLRCDIRRLRRISGAVNGVAEVRTLAYRLRRAEGSASAQAFVQAQGYRLRRGEASAMAVAIVQANGVIWLPLQPERAVRFRRYSQPDFQQQLLNLLPTGRAWPRDGEDAALMSAWSQEAYRVEQRGWQLLEEWDPRTTKELFTDWEAFFELPGTGTEEQRRQALIAEWLAGGTLSRDDIADLLRRLGVVANVEFCRPFRVDVSAVGDALATDWYSTWVVYVENTHEVDLSWLQAYLRRTAPGGDYVHVVAASTSPQ